MKTEIKVMTVFFVGLILCQAVQADELLVPSQYPTIQAAIDAAFDSDEVVIAPGTYTGEGNRDIDFKGKAITVRSRDPNDPNIAAITVIDCDGSAEDKHRGFYFHSNEGSNSVLAGLTITDGYTYQGGAIYFDVGSPTIINCNFSGNTADESGGGMYNYSSSPILTNCTFGGNSALHYGGGMFNWGGSPTLTNCTFTFNSVSEEGGGMFNGGSSPTIIRCTFSRNWADNEGGGMFNVGSSPTITNCIFTSNLAPEGGGICNEHSNSIVTSCMFSNNSAVEGGGMFNWGGRPTVTNCTFSGNWAYELGGGIFNIGHGDLTVTNCTFFDNSASNSGGGIYICCSSLAVTNCIIWDNTAPSGPQISSDGTSWLTFSYCDVQGGLPGTGNIDAEPCFVDASAGNFHLAIGSPCIDAGDNDAVPEGIETDFEGRPRFLDDPATIDTGNGTPPIVDMGAHEYRIAIVIFVDSTASGENDGTSWEDAYKLLQDGLDAAVVSGDEIWVAQGTYYPTAKVGGTGEKYKTFQMKNGVAIRGGYGGYGASEPNERDIELYETILSGDIGVPNDINDNSYQVVKAIDVNSTAILDGFTITAGIGNGGGMGNWGSSPTIISCNFSKNWGCIGGGMFNYENSNPTLTNCTFSENWALLGGGMYNEDSSPKVTNCTFSGNSAHDGGGMFNWDNNTNLTNCIFSGNSAIFGGGGIYISSSSNSMLKNCTFSGNTAGLGGGIFIEDRPFPPMGSLSILDAGVVMCTNCIFWGNMDGWGGSIESAQICVWNLMRNPLVVNYCCIEGLTGDLGGMGNIYAEPCFVDEANGDYHLRSAGWRWDRHREMWMWDELTSPCIDKGNPGSQLGEELLSVPDDPDNEWGENLRINMGAYGGTAEASMARHGWTFLADLNNDENVNFADFAGQMQDWYMAEEEQPGDLNRDSVIDENDLAILAEGWLGHKSFGVRITKPEDGDDTFVWWEIIEVEADAWCAEGSVTKVEFFANWNKIGEDNDGSDGWKINWINHPAGSIDLTANATYSDGTIAGSALVRISILPPPPT